MFFGKILMLCYFVFKKLQKRKGINNKNTVGYNRVSKWHSYHMEDENGEYEKSKYL